MRPSFPRSPESRRLVPLLLLAAWASLLSVESWFRTPGFSIERGLPPRLERDGVVWRRLPGPPAPAASTLPKGVTLLEAADYAPDGADQPGLYLRRVGLATSGTGVHLPVQEQGLALLGEGASGSCVVLDERGNVRASQHTAEAWAAWAAPRRPDRGQQLRWLLGLRPFRANTCLWQGRREAAGP